MKRTAPRAVVVLCLIHVAAAAQHADQPPAFPVAIVRADGAVIPIAAFDGATWSPIETIHERGEKAPALPASLPEEWWFWPRNGREPSRHRRLRTTSVPSHCGALTAIVTDLKVDSPPPPLTWPLEKLGLAVNGSVRVTAARDANKPRTEEDERARASALRLFNLLEGDMLAGRNDPIAKIPSGRRESRAPTLVLQEHGGSYRITARREYPGLSPDCAPSTYLTGWMYLFGSGELHLSDLRVGRSGCETESSGSVELLGIIPFGSSAAWVFVEHGYESEHYWIATVDDRGQVSRPVSVYGGGC